MSELPRTSASSRYRDFFFRIDPRSLGLFRILLSLVLIGLWIIRWRWLNVMYTDTGVLPRATMDELGAFYFPYTPLAWIGSEWGIRLFFVGALVSYLMLLVGFRTRQASVLAAAFFVSISHRNPYVLIGADFVLGSMLIWAMLLPLGRRFSLDAVRKALRADVPLRDRMQSDGSTWDDATLSTPEQIRPTLIALFIVLHFGLIYFFTGIWKTGETWWEKGTALYYVLHMEQSLLPLGALLAKAPLWLLKGLTYGTLVMEYIAPVVFLLPWGQPWLRRILLLALAAFHIGIALTVDAGVFSYAMLACFPLLLLPRDWEALGRLGRRFTHKVTAYYDDNCGICTACCKFLAVADRFGSISFIGNSNVDAFRHDVSPEMGQQTIIVFDEETGRRGIRSHGVAMLLAVLPFPWRLLSFIGWPGIRAISDIGYRLVASNRTRISRLLGMTACSIPQPGARKESAVQKAEETRPRSTTGKRTIGWTACNLAGSAYMICVLAGIYYTNLVPILGLEVDRQSPVTRVGLFLSEGTQLTMTDQNWNMFAPNAPTVDTWWVAEARLEGDGRRIDLFNDGKPAELLRQPRYWESPFSSVWGNYLRHTAALGLLMPRHMIPDYADERAKIHRRAIGDYIMREYEKSSDQEIIEFNLYLVIKFTLPPELPQNDVYAHLSTLTYDNTRPDDDRFYGPDRYAYTEVFNEAGQRIAEGPRDPWDSLSLQGNWTHWTDDGARRLRTGSMVNGVMHGLWREYLPPEMGGGTSEGQMVAGAKEGLWITVLADGTRVEATFEEGQFDGPWRRYFPNGKLESEGQLAMGKRVGQWSSYSLDGAYEERGNFVDDMKNGEWATFEHGVRVKVETFRSNQLHGPWLNSWPNGQPASKGQYADGKKVGRWKEFFEDGSIKEEGEYVAGKKHGEWTLWVAGGFKTTQMYEHGKRVD